MSNGSRAGNALMDTHGALYVVGSIEPNTLSLVNPKNLKVDWQDVSLPNVLEFCLCLQAYGDVFKVVGMAKKLKGSSGDQSQSQPQSQRGA